MTTFPLAQIKSILINAAKEELLPRFAHVKRQQKADGSILTEADMATQQRIARQLLEQWPETTFLGEEMSAQEQQRLLNSEQPIWCLDPLDGTSNFAAGIPYFAVSLALLEAGRVTLGIVYDPIRDECFAAAESVPATLNASPLPPVTSDLSLSQCIAIIDFKRLTRDLAARLVTDIPYASQRSFGAVALDWCWLAAGRGHVYLHGRQNLWDYAAGQYIFSRNGGYSCTLEGDKVFYNALQPRSAVAAVDARLFDEWTSCLEIPR
jgi:myo-inositol-1(or 4)-monophosphatase